MKSTYLYVTLHKRVPNSRNLNQCTKVYRCLPAVVKHILGCCVINIIILICPKMKILKNYSVLRVSADSNQQTSHKKNSASDGFTGEF